MVTFVYINRISRPNPNLPSMLINLSPVKRRAFLFTDFIENLFVMHIRRTNDAQTF